MSLVIPRIEMELSLVDGSYIFKRKGIHIQSVSPDIIILIYVNYYYL